MRLSEKLNRLVRRDASAYRQLVKALSSKRRLAHAQRRAIQSPLEICEATAQADQIIAGLSKVAGPYLCSDLKAGRALLKGAFQAASATVDVNLQAKGLRVGPDGYRRRLHLLRKKIR